MPNGSEAVAATTRTTPASAEEAAQVLAAADRSGRSVRFEGGGTKRTWGAAPSAPFDVELSTAGLDRVVEHNAADLTAVLEGGVPLARAQATFQEAGQMLALDPPDPTREATIGGILATADSGPMRHRYGGIRDQVLGIRVALADGTLSRAGGKVIKNVAGYDLGKLFTGSYGALGLIVEAVVRLHPAPIRRATVIGKGADPHPLRRAAIALANEPLDLEGLDIRWDQETGGAVLARAAGGAPEDRLPRISAVMEEAGLATAQGDDEQEWERQREGQRAGAGQAVVRVSAVRSDLPRVIDAAREVGAHVVGRAGLGLFWMRVAVSDGVGARTIERIRRALAPRPCVVLDAPEELRRDLDVWGPVDGMELMRRIKERFDPNGTCNRGIFVGGL